jgi:phosphoglycolate phosphatase-like HAD superfamily hydrolase
MKTYKLIIFDLDATLSDSFPWFLTVISTVAQKHGLNRVDHHGAEQFMRWTTIRDSDRRGSPLLFLPAPAWALVKLKPAANGGLFFIGRGAIAPCSVSLHGSRTIWPQLRARERFHIDKIVPVRS